MRAPRRVSAVFLAMIVPLFLSACSQSMNFAGGAKSMVAPAGSHGYSERERECLMRAMFFESNRSSRDGLIAVGTVVMNRLRSGKHGNTICEVVGAPRQFAPGVLTRKMNSKALPDVAAAADAVLAGERHKKVKNSMFFHTAGLKFKYRNMHYTVVAGGNAFYEKRNRNGDPVVLPPEKPAVMLASAQTPRGPQARPAMSSRGDGGSTMVAMARPIMSGRADPQVTSPRAATSQRAAPASDAQPITVAMAIDGPTPSARTLAAAPFPATPAPPASRPAAVQAVSFAVDPDDADAIGAMIANEDRPMMGFN